MFMIDEILKKAENNQKLTDEEFLELLNISNDEDLNKLFETAAKIRDQQSKTIKLTSTIHNTNKCQIQPRCEYCGFAEETSSKGYYNAFYKSYTVSIIGSTITSVRPVFKSKEDAQAVWWFEFENY